MQSAVLDVGSLVTDVRFSIWPTADPQGKPWEGLGPLEEAGSVLRLHSQREGKVQASRGGASDRAAAGALLRNFLLLPIEREQFDFKISAHLAGHLVAIRRRLISLPRAKYFCT